MFGYSRTQSFIITFTTAWHWDQSWAMLNLHHAPIPCFFKSNFNTSLPSMPTCCKWPFPFMFSEQISVHVPHLPCTVHTLLISSPWLNHPNILWKVRIMKLITQFPTVLILLSFSLVLILLSSSLSHIQNILITPFSYTLNPSVSLKVEVHIHPKNAIQLYVLHVHAIIDNYIRKR